MFDILQEVFSMIKKGFVFYKRIILTKKDFIAFFVIKKGFVFMM